MPTDQLIIWVVEAVIVICTLFMACLDLVARSLRQSPDPAGHVIRDEEAMTGLYTIYAVSVAVTELLADQATGIEGHRVLFMVTNYACMTYLFFFCSRFRNGMFFPVLERVKRD